MELMLLFVAANIVVGLWAGTRGRLPSTIALALVALVVAVGYLSQRVI